MLYFTIYSPKCQGKKRKLVWSAGALACDRSRLGLKIRTLPQCARENQAKIRDNRCRSFFFMAALDWSQCPAVESVPGKVGGAWVFRGTRMPVATVFENLVAVASIEEIIECSCPLRKLHSKLLVSQRSGIPGRTQNLFVGTMYA
jgi:hypothetical protein